MNESVEHEIAQLRELMGSDRDPDGRAFAPLADALRQAGRLAEAREVVSEGLARHPSFVTGHLVAGRVYRDQGVSGMAEEAFRRVLELDEGNVIALHGLGRMLVVRGQNEEAGALLTRAAELGYTTDLEHEETVTFEDDAGVVADAFTRGEAGDEDDAPPPVTAAGPEHLDAPAGPGAGTGTEDFAGMEDFADAEELREEIAAASTAPEDTAHDEAELEAHVDADPDAGPRTRTMAELYVRQGMPDRAIAVYEHLVRTDPENPELSTRLAELRSRVADGGDPASLRPSPPSGPGSDAPDGDEPTADEWETAARDMAASGHSSPVDSPFTWTGVEAEEPEDAEAAGEAEEAAEEVVVEIGSLAPDTAPGVVMDVGALAPDPADETPVVDIGALAPVGGFVPTMDMDELAPDAPEESEELQVVDVGFLAPDGMEDEDGPIVEIDALAPDEPGEREVVPIGALAPEEDVLDIGVLAPDDSSEGRY